MRRLYLILFLAIFFSSIYAQPIDILFRTKQEKKGLYWYVLGKTGFPDRVLLSCRLFFKEGPVSNSHSNVYVRQGSFVYSFGPVKGRMASGQYQLEIVFSKKKQSSKIVKLLEPFEEFTVKKSFRHGSHPQERSEIEEDRAFFGESVRQVGLFVKALHEDKEKYLGQKPLTDVERVREWLAIMEKRLEELENQINQRSFPAVVCAHSPESVYDLKQMVHHARLLYQSSLAEVCKRYEWPLPKKYEDATVHAPADVQRFTERIGEIEKRISKRESFTAYLDEKNLENDLKWFNDIFGSLVRHYRSQQDKPSPERWNDVVVFVKQEIEGFQTRATRYKRSALENANPNLVNDLDRLSKGCGSLLAEYERSVQEGKTRKETENILDRIRKDFASIYQIVEKKKQQDQEEENRQREKLQKSIEALVLLEKELEAITKDGSFSEKIVLWETKRASLDSQLGDFKERFPLLRGRLGMSVSFLEKIADIYARQKNEPGFDARAYFQKDLERAYKDNPQITSEQIRKMVQEKAAANQLPSLEQVVQDYKRQLKLQIAYIQTEFSRLEKK